MIYAWRELRDSINNSNSEWLDPVRRPTGQGKKEKPSLDEEPGFYSQQSLIATDQGMRGFLMTLNDICYVMAPKLKLNDWILKPTSGAVHDTAISSALKSLSDQPVAKTVQAIAKGLASFDWRTSTANGLKDSERQLKLVFRGSGGYKELRRQLLKHLSKQSGAVGEAAERLLASSA